MIRIIPLSFVLICFTCLGQSEPGDTAIIERVQLPQGYHIEIYSDSVPNARAMDFAEDGTLFVGSRVEGSLYAITPSKEVIVIDTGLELPTGLDYFEGDLYVSEVSRINKYPDILSNYTRSPDPVVIRDDLPSETWHGWKFIRVGPDRKLYVPVGAPCNVCLREEALYSTILRMNLDGSNLEIFAEGVRNTVGFDWDPGSNGVLWFTDNGRDYMGDDLPPDELNKAPVHGKHYGFPFIHGHTRDPEFWDQLPPGKGFISPAKELPAHVAALGMRFYTGDMFEEKYRGGIFIAEHGSWNRSSKVGYRVTFLPVKEGRVMEYEVFASGWMKDEKVYGRPADVQVGPDGALYVSDDFAGCIYRIYYQP
jgi:glucose/arabinose dehydrogenase